MSNSSTAKPTINGCGNIKEDFTNLCDLDALWGIIVSGFAALGLLLTFVFTIIFSVNLKRYVRHQRHHYSTLLYFVLLGAFLLFAFSIAFVIKPSPIVCCLRRVGFGMACVVVLAPLFVGITRTWRMSYLDELRCGFLGMAVVCIVLVEAIILAEWNILKRPTVLSSGRCEENENDLVYSSSFNGLVLILFFISTMVACCKKDHHVTTRKRLNGYVMSCLAISVLLVLLTTAWATMICYGNEKLGKPEWSDPTTAMFMVVCGLVVILLIFCPIVHSMRQIYSTRHHDLHMNEFQHDLSRGSYDKATSQTTLPSTEHVTSSYGPVEQLERRSFRTQSAQQNVVVMSPLSTDKPVPTKRNGTNYRVDRVRPPTGGRANPSLVLHEEDIVRGRY